jgi:hypothetical protein
MARVLGSVLRIRIMSVLSAGPMSPTMIHWELDGEYEVSTIDKNLKELKRYGWVELADTMTGGARRGGVEHVYRAIRSPIFDDVIWPALPLTMREMVSWGIFEGLVKCMTDVWDVGTLDARSDRHLSCTPGHVDQLGWDRTMAAVNGFFEGCLVEAADAGERIADSGEQPVPALVALTCFESPADVPPIAGADSRLGKTSSVDSTHGLNVRMAKTMGDPLCRMVVDELSARAMSAKMFNEEFAGRPIEGLYGKTVHKSAVYRAFRKLKHFDWLVLAETEPQGRRQPKQERFYRAVRSPIVDRNSWPTLPNAMRDDPTGRIFESWVERTCEAVRCQTMDARVHRHLSWMPIGLDRLGWGRTIKRIEELHAFVLGEQADAGIRLEGSGEEPIPITVGLAVVESAVTATRLEPGLHLV